jgi:mono/diheme cytochrome c family protein
MNLIRSGAACYVATLLLPSPAAPLELEDLDGGLEAAPLSDSAAARGKYVLRAAGCVTCHTAEQDDGVPLAGGHALETEYGTFYSPNITPDMRTGIGGWDVDDFRRAVREGIAPDGSYYYPAFPYPSYAGMSDADVDDLFAYLQTVQPVERSVPAHDLGFPYRSRSLLSIWRWLFFEPGGYVPTRDADDPWNRGAYLVNALGHCGECHTPRGMLGALDLDRHLTGTSGEDSAPNITAGGDIGRWSRGDLIYFLQTGFFPDNDVAGSGMGAVIADSTSTLTETDLESVAQYLLSIE